MSQLTVVGICGSLRPLSYTRMAVNLALQGAKDLGSRVKLIDLRNYDLVLCDGNENEGNYPQNVFKLRKDVRQGHGIILGTPQYHGSFSGVLKNAIDLMGFDEFEGRMVGLVGVSGGKGGALDALNSLQSICRVLHAWVIPEQASIPEAWKFFDEHGRPKNRELADRVKEVGRQVARYAYLHTSEKALEFLRLWESAPINPGGVSKNR